MKQISYEKLLTHVPAEFIFGCVNVDLSTVCSMTRYTFICDWETKIVFKQFIMFSGSAVEPSSTRNNLVINVVCGRKSNFSKAGCKSVSRLFMELFWGILNRLKPKKKRKKMFAGTLQGLVYSLCQKGIFTSTFEVFIKQTLERLFKCFLHCEDLRL